MTCGIENAISIREFRHRNMGIGLGEGPEPADHLQVLLVEDDEADIYLIKRALTENPRVGHVTVAHDGVEALDFLDGGSIRPDVAIVDLHMPRKDGMALLLELSLREGGVFPAIVLTSSKSSADAMRARRRGAEMYLVKPDTMEAMTSLMAEVISHL